MFGLFIVGEILSVAVCVCTDDAVKDASCDYCVEHILIEVGAVVCGVGFGNVFIENRIRSKVAENLRKGGVEDEHESAGEQ